MLKVIKKSSPFEIAFNFGLKMAFSKLRLIFLLELTDKVVIVISSPY
jgi:hypothetical protein